MGDGFVKFHRSINQNELLSNDNTCWIVFTKLLILVDWKTGKVITGRHKLAAYTNLNGNTLYSALKRLEASTIIQQQSNKKSTTITICNWHKYQQDINKASSRRQSSVNTIQEEEKEEEIDTKVSKAVAKTPKTDIDEMFVMWESIIGYPIDGQKTKNRYACNNLLKKYKKDGLTGMIRGVQLAQQDKYAPRISDFTSLQSKQNDLIAWGKTQKISTMKKVVAV